MLATFNELVNACSV